MNFQNLNFEHVEPPRPNSPPTVVPRVPSAPSLPHQRMSSLSSSTEPEVYGPDRLFGAPQVHAPAQAQVARAYSRPIVIEGPLRRVPDLPISPSYPPREWEASFNAAMATDFRDQLARLEGVVTPGVDDTPYIQYAIEALTRHRDRDTGYGDGDSSSDDGVDPPAPPFFPGQQPFFYQPFSPQQDGYTHDPAPMPMPPAQTHGVYIPQPPPAQIPQGQTRYDPRFLEHLEPPRPVQDPRASAETLASSLKNGQRMTQPYEWRPVDKDFIVSTIGEQKGAGVPDLNYRPTALRTPSLVALMLLCVLMIAALILSAVYSELHRGLLPYVSIYGGQYFLFRVLPPVVGAILLLYVQFIITTVFRTLPFVRLASDNRDERDGALFQELYPNSFLWPQLVGTWQTWVPILITWSANLTIPLQNSLFTVLLVDGQWTWATTQGVAWTLVALYLALFVSTVIVWRYWANLESTGLIWDPRSLADVAAIVSDTNISDDYHGTQLAKTREGIRFALRRRAGDRLGYWTWKDGRRGFWYTLGASLDNLNTLPLTQEQLTGQRMAKDGEKRTMFDEQGVRVSDIDIEGSGRSAQGRHRYLPWCLRNNQVLYFIVTTFIFLLALFIVSFLPSTRVTDGFLPGLPAAPTPGAFSAANFLYSFIPSLLGTIMFLLFQSLDMNVRILQPWANLSDPRGARASHSILADYAACAPLQSSFRALRNGDYRVAAISLLATLFILIPTLAGATFMALTPPSGVVHMFPNIPAFAITLSFLVLYLVALISLFPGRKSFRLPHAVTCLAEIISFLANEDLLSDLSFKQCRSRGEMLSKLGVNSRGKGKVDTQSVWVFGGGNSAGVGGVEGGGEEVLGIRRMRRFTEKRKVRKSQIRRGGRFGKIVV
ncbi:protein piccolo [Podospora aff. communis PSN243]|uniref:Protein piccolo n=1 Tax=Podospora aff. communis PSN243 TaxID=3040156 RepID=A0AAV9GY31_9PEZI|nr:protein piccolo [Podospora aff. communis PSN243]